MFVCRYRYTLEELHSLTTAVHTKAEVYTTWSQAVDNVLEGFVQPRPGECVIVGGGMIVMDHSGVVS